LILMEGSSLKE